MNTIKTVISLVTLVTSLVVAVAQLKKAIDTLRDKQSDDERESRSNRNAEAVA